MTYVQITRTLIENFDLQPPEWWLVLFRYDKNRGMYIRNRRQGEDPKLVK
jgi:hypothetical protein